MSTHLCCTSLSNCFGSPGIRCIPCLISVREKTQSAEAHRMSKKIHHYENKQHLGHFLLHLCLRLLHYLTDVVGDKYA